jgi:hypothetical protein
MIKLKWQWFLGGRIMFWVSIIIFIVLIIEFVITYIIDPTSCLYITKYKIDPASIEKVSQSYVDSLGITIDKPIEYSFVRYRDKGYEANPGEEILLGTFHEWNGVYYINISIDLYKGSSLADIVIHETRHMIVEYLKDKKIIDLTKYTEEIAQRKNTYYNNLFNSGVHLLKEKENENG